MLAYRVLKTVTNEPKHLALFSLLSLGETGVLTVLLKTFNLGNLIIESNDPSTEIVPNGGKFGHNETPYLSERGHSGDHPAVQTLACD